MIRGGLFLQRALPRSFFSVRNRGNLNVAAVPPRRQDDFLLRARRKLRSEVKERQGTEFVEGEGGGSGGIKVGPVLMN